MNRVVFASLGQVAKLNPTFKANDVAPDELVDFLPMSAVSAELTTACAAEQRPFSEVRKGYTNFADGDVLLAKITPCFENGKIAFAKVNTNYGFGSTEFHVIRADKDRLDGRYLVHFLRRDEIRIDGARNMTGSAGQRRVPKHYLESLSVPLPLLHDQRRIAAILDQADALRAKRREALAQLDSLTQSIFVEMFGDPATNPNSWPLTRLDSLFSTSPIFGTMIPGVAGQGKHLCLRVANIQDWQLDLSDQKFVDLPPSMLERHSVRDGDLLLARAIATQELLGKCIVARPGEREWAFDSHLMRLRFRSDRVQPDFIRQALRTSGGRSIFLACSRKSTVQYNINTKEIAALQLPIPPIGLQQTFLERLQVIDSLKATHRAALQELDRLFASLQHRAFSGEL